MLRRSFQSYYSTDGILFGWRVWARPWSISKKQLGGKKGLAKLTDPIEIYETLDRASDKRPTAPGAESDS